MTPTIVLVHGAFAESSSWNDVADRLVDEGHRVIAYANPLRSVAGDAAGLTELVRTIDGPVVLAGHSYGGAVMTNVPADAGEIVGLVYVAAFALEAGESPADAAGSVPGRHARRDAPARPAARRRRRRLHPAGQVPPAVLRRRPRAPGPADGDHAAADRRGRAGRGLGRRAAVEDGPELVHLRRAGPQHPGRRAPQHGRAGRLAGAPSRSPARRTSSAISHPAETAELILEAAHVSSPA